MLTPLLLATSTLVGIPSPWYSLPTHPQVEIRTLAPAHPQAPVLIIAPGQSCNARRPFFEAIESAALAQGLGLVRMEWSYCRQPEGQRQPSPKLAREQAEVSAVISWASQELSLTGRPLLLAGKSLGSLVSYEVFSQTPTLKGLALLTPVCSYATDEQGNPQKIPLNTMAKHYPALGSDLRPQLVSGGSQDELCHLPYLYQAIQQSGPQLTLQTFEGGHSLGIFTPDNKENTQASARNLKVFAEALVNWSLSQR